MNTDAAPGEAFDFIHGHVVRFFPNLVEDLGGDPQSLFRQAEIDPTLLAEGKSGSAYRQFVILLALAAETLNCPDFGMRLASRQGGSKAFGPLEGAMMNSRTLGDAMAYATRHVSAYSLAARIRWQRHPASQTVFLGHDILLDRLPDKRQAMEQILLLAHLNALEMTGGRARVRRVFFRHQPLSPLKTYRRHFGCDVRFGQQEDGTVFYERDLSCLIVDPDRQAYEKAASFIESKFPRRSPPLQAQVRGIVMQFIGTEYCSNERVADELNLHSRTLHRQLKAAGTSFKQIKDEVRRDLLHFHLKHTDLDLTSIAGKLGYAEHSVLTRSCIRWFSAPPSRVRASIRS